MFLHLVNFFERLAKANIHSTATEGFLSGPLLFMTSLSYFHLGCALNNISTNVSTWNCTGMGQKASLAIQMVLKIPKKCKIVGNVTTSGRGLLCSIVKIFLNIFFSEWNQSIFFTLMKWWFYNYRHFLIALFFPFLAHCIIYDAITCHSLEDNGLKANPESTKKKKKKTKSNILWFSVDQQQSTYMYKIIHLWKIRTVPNFVNTYSQI